MMHVLSLPNHELSWPIPHADTADTGGLRQGVIITDLYNEDFVNATWPTQRFRNGPMFLAISQAQATTDIAVLAQLARASGSATHVAALTAVALSDLGYSTALLATPALWPVIRVAPIQNRRGGWLSFHHSGAPAFDDLELTFLLRTLGFRFADLIAWPVAEAMFANHPMAPMSVIAHDGLLSGHTT